MALAHYQGYVENVSTGKALPDAVIRVYSFPANVLQSTFADPSSTPKPVVSSDANGAFNFYIPDGVYDLEYVYNGDVLTRLTNIPIYNPANALPAAEMAASGGSALVGYIQSGGVATTAQERLRREVWAEDFMTLPASGDQTAAFQAAIDSLSVNGGTVRFRGDYTIGTTNPIRFPAEPKIVHLLGEGRSILRQGAANAPMIAKVAGVSRIIGAHIKGFTVVAHVDSLKATATNILINIAGFDWSEIDVEYQSNATTTATTGRAHAVIAGHANGIPCYGNTIRVKLAQTAGPSKGVWLHNNGGTSLANANANKVSVWGYAMAGCDYLVDAADSTQTVIDFGLLEDCPDSIGVRMGNYTKIKDKWPELLLAIAEFGSTAATTANNCVVEFTQLSGNGTFIITDAVTAPPRFNDVLFSGATHYIKSLAARAIGTISGTVLTVTSVRSGALAVGQSVGNALTGTTITSLGTGTGGTGTYNISVSQTVTADTTFVLGVPTTNYVMPTVAKQTPAEPTLAWLLNTGAFSANATAYRFRPDHHGVVTWFGNYNVTPGATGRAVLQVSPPAGYEIEQIEIGVEEIGVATRDVALSADSQGRNHSIYWPNVNVHNINFRVTMRAT